MKTISRIVVPVLAILLLVTIGNAATISFTDYVPGTPTDGSFGTLNFSGTFTLPQFDTSQGTLTGVSLQYTSAWQNVIADYDYGGDAPGSLEVEGVFRSILTGVGLIQQLQTDPLLFSISDSDFQPLESLGIGPLSGSNGPTNVIILAGLGAFEGNGNLLFNLAASLRVLTINEGTFTGGTTADGRGILTITYTFDEAPQVPEPSTMLLLGGGLLALGFARRFRKN